MYFLQNVLRLLNENKQDGGDSTKQCGNDWVLNKERWSIQKRIMHLSSECQRDSFMQTEKDILQLFYKGKADTFSVFSREFPPDNYAERAHPQAFDWSGGFWLVRLFFFITEQPFAWRQKVMIWTLTTRKVSMAEPMGFWKCTIYITFKTWSQRTMETESKVCSKYLLDAVGYKNHCWAVPPSLDCRA